MIKKKEAQPEQILEATCDCCDKPLKIDFLGTVEDHMTLRGFKSGKILEAVICHPCLEKKLSFIKVTKSDSTIGNC